MIGPFRRPCRATILLLVLLATTQACSKSDTGGPNPTGSFALGVTPTSLSITQGTNGTVTVNLTRTNFTGAVTLTAEGLPAGVTASFATSPAAGTSATLTLAASAAAAAGAATVTIRGAATGQPDQTATVALTVTAAASGSYALSLTPTTLTVAQGGNSSVTVNLARTNFAGAVTLATQGLPAGVTAAFNASPTTANSATLTVTASATATTGTTSVTIRGTAAGLTDRTATLALTIITPPAGSYSIALSPTAGTLTQGVGGVVQVTLTRTNFTGAVTLAAENVPNGVTASFNPNPATGNSVLTLIASATATIGFVNVIVRGTAAGQTDQTATLMLFVAAPSYSLALAPTSLSIAQGTNGSVTINLTRANFTNAVTLTAEGLPAGVTASFNTSPTTGNSATLTLTASATATLGTTNVTIRGAASGTTDQTAVLALTVRVP